MAKKDCSGIGSLLNKPHLDGASVTEMAPPDPKIRTRIKVTLDQLVPYANNPRKTRNPEYDDIKESIRNRGLDHAPNITREKPTDPYMIKDGGNTRLEILNELWDETQDPRFYELDCVFYPWTDDLDVLVGHMIENELRGHMLFIERAIAAAQIKSMLENMDSSTLSIRESARRISAIGWTVNQSALTQLIYAYNVLFPVIPNAFWGGLGRDSVQKIRKLLDTCRKYWEAVAKDNEGDLDSIWTAVFSELDEGDGFELEAAEYKLAGEFAVRLDGPLMTVRAQLQAISEGFDLPIERPTHFTNPDFNKKTEPAKVPGKATPAAAAGSEAIAPTAPAEQSQGVASETTRSTNTAVDQELPTTLVEFPAQHEDAPVLESDTSEAPVALQPTHSTPPAQSDYQEPELGAPSSFQYLVELKTAELQALAGDTAAAYADLHNLEFCVAHAADVGFSGQDGWHSGFVVYRPQDQDQLNYILDDLGRVVHYQHLFQLSIALRALDQEVPDEWVTSPHPLDPDNNTAFTDYFSVKAPSVRSFILGMMLHDGNPDAAHVPSFQMLTELEAIIGVLMHRMMSEAGRLW